MIARGIMERARTRGRREELARVEERREERGGEEKEGEGGWKRKLRVELKG